MRILFSSTTLPKKAAKRLQSFRSLNDDELTLGIAQNITAQMLGYSSWTELNAFTETNKLLSPLDEDITPQERQSRYAYQEMQLSEHAQYFPDAPTAIQDVVRLVEVSARSPSNETLPEFSSGDFIIPGGTEPIFYNESIRALLFATEIDELSLDFEDELLPPELSDRLISFCARFPDNVGAISLTLNNLHKQGLSYPDESGISAMEEYLDSLYGKLVETRAPALSWHMHENRDFLRAIFQISEHFRVTKNALKRDLWVSRLRNMTSVFNRELKK